MRYDKLVEEAQPDETAQVELEAAREILMLEAEIKEAQERVAALKSYFKDPQRFGPGKYERGPVEIVVSTNQRISQTKAARVLSKARLNSISTPKVDTKKARALLTETELRAIMDTYDHKIEVRLGKDGAQ